MYQYRYARGMLCSSLMVSYSYGALSFHWREYALCQGCSLRAIFMVWSASGSTQACILLVDCTRPLGDEAQ